MHAGFSHFLYNNSEFLKSISDRDIIPNEKFHDEITYVLIDFVKDFFLIEVF